MIQLELILFTTFTAISFTLIALGLFRLEHTELSLVGFVFLFLLSMVIIGGNIEYQTGYNVTYHYNESTTPPPPQGTELTSEHVVYTYAPYEDTAGFFTTHRFGYLLAVMSVIGMIGSFVSIKPERFMK